MPQDHVPHKPVPPEQDQARRRRPWPDDLPPQYMHDFGLATTLVLAMVALVLGQAAGVCAVAVAGRSLAPAAVDGTGVALFHLVSMPVQVITLVLAVRMTDARLFDYLGISLPSRREIEVAAAGMMILITAGDIVTFVSGHALVPAYDIAIHRTALAEGMLLPLWFALIILLPAGEELLLRGFLFRGFVRNPMTSVPGVLTIALIWTLLHMQSDDVVANLLLFLVSAYLGVIRLVSGSTTLVILIHVLWSLESVLETTIALGWVF